MSFETLKATINSNIVSGLPDGIRADYENNPTLQDIVSAFGQDHIYMGSATVGTSPMTDDNARMYISSGSGEFTAFRDSGNNAINISEGEIAILKGISGVYEKDVFFSGDTIDDAGSVRINDTGSLIQLQARYNGSWVTASEFGYIGGDITLQDVVSSSVNANSVVVNGSVESTSNTDVKDYLCIDGEVLVSPNEYLYADEFIEDRLESTTGEYIPNTASNSLAEIGMDTINDKCVLYNEAVTSEVGVIESIIPNSTDGDFDVTRNSITNRINRDGFIEQVPTNTASYNYTSGDTRPYLLTEAASTNLITYPESFGNSYWTKSGASIEGDSSTAGSELVTDGVFADPLNTNWTTNGDWTIAGGSGAVFTYTTSLKYITQPFIIADNAFIQLTFTISGASGGGASIKFTNEATNLLFGGAYTPLYPDGTYTLYYNTLEAATGIRIYANTNSFTIDNVSVKEVQGFESPKEIPSDNGVELVTNGTFDTDSDWVKGTGWSIGSGVANCSGGTGQVLYQSSILPIGTVYKLTITVSSITSGYLSALGGDWDSQLITTAGTFIRYSRSLSADIGIVGNNFIGSVDDVSVKEVTSLSGGGFEKEAYKLVEDTTNGINFLRASGFSQLATDNVSLSIYAKAGESKSVILYEDYSDEGVVFNLETEAITAYRGTPVSSSMEALSNGWYRLNLTVFPNYTISQYKVIMVDQDGATTFTGDGTSGLYIAYAQLEVSDYASSLMLPTTEGSTTSRVADVVNNAGNQSLFSGVNNSGVLYAEIAANSNNLTSRTISISDGTTDNRVNLNLTNALNKVEMVVFVGGLLQTVIDYTITDETEFQKVAVRYAQDDFSLWIDGVEMATDTSGITFPTNTLNECRFDRGATSQVFYGKTNAIAVFDYLSDNEMIRLTK